MANNKRKSGWERWGKFLQTTGASLRDVSAGFRGEPGGYLFQLEKMRQEAERWRQEQEARQMLQQWIQGQTGDIGQPQVTFDPMTGRPVTVSTIPGVQATLPTTTEAKPTFPLTGIPSAQYGITGMNIGGIQWGETPESKTQRKIAEEQILAPIKGKSQATTQEIKYSEQKARDYRRVRLKLEQSADLLARAYKKSIDTARRTGIPLQPSRGISGRVFGLYQRALGATGYNEFIKTFRGNLNETAIAMMRMLMPGRSERLVNLLKMTLPDLTGNPYEDVAQVAESMTAAFTESLVTARDKYGDFRVDEQEASRLRDEFREMSYSALRDIFVKAEILTPAQAQTIRSKSAIRPQQQNINTLRRLGLDPNRFEVIR